jgi:hypothetical protein
VPFVFAGLHTRSLSPSIALISLLLGCYQLSRVAGNRTVKLLGPRASLLAGAACGLLGYLTLAIAISSLLPAATAADTAAAGHNSSSATVQLAWLGASLVLVGLSEQIAALQIFCKRRYQQDPAAVRTRLLQQVCLYTLQPCMLQLQPLLFRRIVDLLLVSNAATLIGPVNLHA